MGKKLESKCDRVLSYLTEEFVGHTASVKCLALGHKSGRVMVTGGDDKKVNMWAVGKPNCIMVGSHRTHFYLIFSKLSSRPARPDQITCKSDTTAVSAP